MYFIKKIFIYLAASGLSCPEACGILVPQLRTELLSPSLEGRFCYSLKNWGEGDNCFTVLYWFLPYIMNQPQVYIRLLSLESLYFLPHPIPPGSYRALGWAPCVTQQIPTSYLFYIWWYVCFHATLNSSYPTLFYCVYKSVPYVCVSVAALQIGSSVTSRFHVHALIYNICLSLSDLIHSEHWGTCVSFNYGFLRVYIQ